MLERPVDLDFQPAKLDFTNYNDLKKSVDEFAAKYHGFVFTREDKSVALKARTELKSILDSIESNRKRVKQVYNKPLSVFEQQIKDLTDAINEPLNDIRAGLKEIDGYEKDEREGALKSFLDVLTKDSTITPDDIQIDPRWLNKGNWTDKLRPITKLQDELEHAVDEAIKVKQKRETDLKVLTEFCKAKEIDPAGWISQLDFKSVTEVMDIINADLEHKRQVAEKQETKRKEFEASQTKQKETVEEAADVQEKPIPEELLITDVIQVTGTLFQLNGMNQYLVDHNIKVVLVHDDTTDDLPF